jgi:hypothetical protein
MPLDYERIRAGIRAFRRSPRAFIHFVWRGVRIWWSDGSPHSRPLWRAVSQGAALSVWFVTGLLDRPRR